MRSLQRWIWSFRRWEDVCALYGIKLFDSRHLQSIMSVGFSYAVYSSLMAFKALLGSCRMLRAPVAISALLVKRVLMAAVLNVGLAFFYIDSASDSH